MDYIYNVKLKKEIKIYILNDLFEIISTIYRTSVVSPSHLTIFFWRVEIGHDFFVITDADIFRRYSPGKYVLVSYILLYNNIFKERFLYQ